MDRETALEIVSYKLGLKMGEEALEDPVLLTDVVRKAIQDKADADPKSYGLREYMTATKVVNEVRLDYAKIEGDQWIEKMVEEKGLTQTESGLAYKVIEQGEGRACEEGATVRVNYEGKLMDGTEFDSSYDRGRPATFPLDSVIAGWQEGLKLMNVGGRYQFYVPQALGYGERGSGTNIPPYAALFFEVELLAAL